MKKAKPFCISKKEVWEAYQRVKASRGAAGTDGQTIEDFERKLKKNLYKIWNRMASGSYFPPPVRTVKIPKKSGGERSLGIVLPVLPDRESDIPSIGEIAGPPKQPRQTTSGIAKRKGNSG
ncbi:MAG: Retron-type reverse transcriptase [Edaphobacter sp.]|nr:Retron-type reverse transcriptase [Edaphobacter sp.]